MTASLVPVSDTLRRRLSGTPLVVMLDVDGTLSQIAQRPEEATVAPETRRAVAALAARRNVHVALVSGRAAADARRMVSVANVWVIGNHGYEIVSPGGDDLVDASMERYRSAIARAASRIAPKVAGVPGVIFEDKGWTLSIHYRLADPAVVPRLKASVRDVAVSLGLLLTEGKMVLEVRPPARVDKGTAVVMLGERLGGLKQNGACVFVGDDRTDEDAFRALRAKSSEVVTARVTHGETIPTAAEFTVRDTDEVRSFLEWLSAASN